MKDLLTNPEILYLAASLLTYLANLYFVGWQAVRSQPIGFILLAILWPLFWPSIVLYMCYIKLKSMAGIKPRQLFCCHDFEFAYWIPEEHMYVHRCHKCGKTRGYELLEDGTEGEKLF